MNYKKFEDYENYIIFKTGKIFSLIRNRFLKPCNNRGYLVVNMTNSTKQTLLRVSRILGLLFVPNPENKPEVDHINNNSLDNRLVNLRWADSTEQKYNRGINRNNTSGVKGVGFCKERKKWVSSLMVNRKNISKRFESKEEAIVYRRELEIKYLGTDYIV